MNKAIIPMRPPHSEKQKQMITYPGNVAAFCGRRFGKTDAYVQRVYKHMAAEPGLYWWVGLSWRSASMKRAWRIVTHTARQVLRAMGESDRGRINRSTFEIKLPGMGEIWFRTADNPASLAGEGIRGAVVDEFSLMPEVVWTEYLEGTLLDYGGWVAFSGVPKGRNWAANIWQKAATRPNWLQIHATTYDNPFINHAKINEVRDNSSEMMFRQEYLAEIIDDAGGVFRGVAGVSTGQVQEPEPGAQYVMGIDWAFSNDYTVVSVMRIDGTQVYIDRYNNVDYSMQRERIAALCQRYPPAVVISENNAMGQPNNEELVARGIPVQMFTTTSASKAAIIQALAGAIERQQVTLLDDPVQIGELQAYEGKRGLGGLVKYSAPDGMHDDTVMALALAYSGISKGGMFA